MEIETPTSFQLAGNTWTVLYKPKKEMKSEGVDCYGLCFEPKNEIWIYNRLGKAKRVQTFLHEAGHALLYTLGYIEHDEQMVESTAQLVYQLLQTLESDDGTILGTEE